MWSKERRKQLAESYSSDSFLCVSPVFCQSSGEVVIGAEKGALMNGPDLQILQRFPEQ